MNDYLNNEKILSNFIVGFEFEFYSDFNRKETAKLLENYLGVKVVIPTVVMGLDKEVTPVHSEFHPTEDEWKLEPDYSGGKEMMELVSGPMNYNKARLYLIKVLQWISKNGYTTKRTGIHLNIGIENFKRINLKNDITHIDRLKFCLTFDENKVFDLFPHRLNNVYSASIKTITPINAYVYKLNVKSIDPTNYLIPTTKYFGVNFLKQEKNYLEFRYLGGENYEEKIKSILDLLEYFAMTIYNVLKNPSYTTDDITTLNTILSKHTKMVNSFSDYDIFKHYYKKIKITVDLSNNETIIKTFYNDILRDKIYDLIVFGQIEKGLINYDRDVSKIQIKNAVIKNASRLNNIEFFNCEVNGIIIDCEFYNCKIDNSIIENCKLNKNNEIIFSKIKNTNIEFKNKIHDCYVENKGFLTNGTYEKCIFRTGKPNKMAIVKDCYYVEKN